ncbi:MAG: hypothetical protein ACRD0U_18220 [Acidimicrobiales bacterium]
MRIARCSRLRRQELYHSPRNLFVATFIGSPAMNLVLGRLRAADDRLSLEFEFGPQMLAVPPGAVASRPSLQALSTTQSSWASDRSTSGIRPVGMSREWVG